MPFKHLFDSIHIGPLKIKNRLVVPPMGTNFATPDGYVTQQLIDYYTARAAGGFGLIIVEICSVDPLGKAIPNQIGLHSDEFVPGLRTLTDAVHANGAKIIAQIHHAGRQTTPEIIGSKPVAPSAVSCPSTKIVPRELTAVEIRELTEKFGDAAKRAENAGFDGVEVHGAHGYLIAQFMSAHANKRTDEYGGSIASRMKFPLDIIENIRSKTKKGFAVVFRFSAEERVQDGIDLQQAAVIAKMLENASADALHVSVGSYGSMQWLIAPSCVAPGYNVHAAKAVKSVVDIPVIAVGRIDDPHLADSILADKCADMVSIGRGSLADPEFPNKISEGRPAEIAPCIACEQSCISYLFDPNVGKISCLVNPLTGNEGMIKILPSTKPKKVMVAGAGPGGLYVSWILGSRGHNVTCYEKQAVIGGEFRIASLPPGKQEFSKAIKYYKLMCDKYGVRFVLNTEVTEELIKAERPDTLIVATGSKALLPQIQGIDNIRFVKAVDVLDGKAIAGHKVLIAGGGAAGAETAHFLGERGHQVTIIEKTEQIASDMPAGVRQFLMEDLVKYKTIMITGAQITKFADNGVEYEKQATAILDGFDTVILALGTEPYDPLGADIKQLVREYYIIGDAKKAGKANEAIEDALRIATAVN